MFYRLPETGDTLSGSVMVKPTNEIHIAELSKDIAYIRETMGEVRADIKEIKGEYVRREELAKFRDEVKAEIARFITEDRFTPVELAYKRMMGVGGVLLLGILGMVVAHVIPGFKL